MAHPLSDGPVVTIIKQTSVNQQRHAINVDPHQLSLELCQRRPDCECPPWEVMYQSAFDRDTLCFTEYARRLAAKCLSWPVVGPSHYEIAHCDLHCCQLLPQRRILLLQCCHLCTKPLCTHWAAVTHVLYLLPNRWLQRTVQRSAEWVSTTS